MFLVFYIVLTIYISQGNCFNVKRDDNDSALYNRATTSNYNNLLGLIQNTRKSTNLKSNIFDKMLSNEMLSIKQHLFEKDVTSSVYKSFKNNVATPTLEINQKWPIEKMIHEVNVTSNFENINTDEPTIDGVQYKNLVRSEIEKDENDNFHMGLESSKKVLEVRSFSITPNHNTRSLPSMQQAKRQCTCVRHDQLKLFSHSNNGIPNTEKICTHTNNNNNDYRHVSECTRTSEAYSVSLTYFPYYAYPYFVGVTTNPFHSYYHPDVLNNVKLNNGKKYKNIKKPYNYEELSKTEASKKVDVDNDNDSDDDDKNQYDYLEDDDATEKIHNGNIKVIDRDDFVENIIEDLKFYYNDAIIKDCYCSLSPLKNYLNVFYCCIAFVLYCV